MSKWTEADIPEQSGRVVVVTGGNSGIGFEAARALVEKGARVIIACRNEAKAEDAARQIEDVTTGEGTVEAMTLDLASLDSIADFAERFLGDNEKLDRLINNAGVMVPPFGKTADGFELQFGTNHLGHFALTGRLLPALLATPGSRVVTVSSMAHRGGRVDFENLNAEKGYDKIAAYGLSKLANLLFTYELQRRLEMVRADCSAVAAHPGWSATNLQSHSVVFAALNPLFGQKQSMGALPTLYAATSSLVEGGDFIGPDGLFEMRGHPKKVQSNARSQDLSVARELWDVSIELTGVGFDELRPR